MTTTAAGAEAPAVALLSRSLPGRPRTRKQGQLNGRRAVMVLAGLDVCVQPWGLLRAAPCGASRRTARGHARARGETGRPCRSSTAAGRGKASGRGYRRSPSGPPARPTSSSRSCKTKAGGDERPRPPQSPTAHSAPARRATSAIRPDPRPKQYAANLRGRAQEKLCRAARGPRRSEASEAGGGTAGGRPARLVVKPLLLCRGPRAPGRRLGRGTRRFCVPRPGRAEAAPTTSVSPSTSTGSADIAATAANATTAASFSSSATHGGGRSGGVVAVRVLQARVRSK